MRLENNHTFLLMDLPSPSVVENQGERGKTHLGTGLMSWFYRKPSNEYLCLSILVGRGFPGDSSKESTCNAEDTGQVGLIPGLGRSSGGGHGNPLQYCCLGNPMDIGAW